jgi:radical SAM protein with 4Fe4S-binding SPASM domain
VLLPTQAQRDEAAHIAREAREQYRGTMEIVFVQVDYFTEEPKPCMGGWARTYMCITPTGEVLPCHAARIIPNLYFDNVQQQSLTTIWRESLALNAFRGDAWMQEPCRSCYKRKILAAVALPGILVDRGCDSNWSCLPSLSLSTHRLRCGRCGGTRDCSACLSRPENSERLLARL